jgi:hypothetical protein
MGKDCTAIEGVLDVICVNGQCLVQQCKKGYTIEGHGCIRSSASFDETAVHLDILGVRNGKMKREKLPIPTLVPVEDFPKTDPAHMERNGDAKGTEDNMLTNADYRKKVRHLYDSKLEAFGDVVTDLD